jgi:Eco29kI restriction endonuclease
VTGQVIPFNPLDKKNLGSSVAAALMGQPAKPLGDLRAFYGAGIYAIYYSGKFKPYAAIALRNQGTEPEMPIYVGKAIPVGGRKGGALPDATKSKALFSRLREHADTVAITSNLDISDFRCRYLVVDDIWIPLGESLLISEFTPLWNSLVDGFGNHDPGAGRYKGLRPRWDVLHPGRSWADKCQVRPETTQTISADIEEFLRAINTEN